MRKFAIHPRVQPYVTVSENWVVVVVVLAMAFGSLPLLRVATSLTSWLLWFTAYAVVVVLPGSYVLGRWVVRTANQRRSE